MNQANFERRTPNVQHPTPKSGFSFVGRCELSVGRWTLSVGCWALMVSLLLPAVRLSAADLVCEGVLGNSGGQGASLVLFGPLSARSLGAVVDRWGCLWDRAGRGTLIRCAADGRMLARYRISDDEHHYNDRAAMAGDRLVLLLRNRLYALACEAAAGSAATSLAQQADALAPTAWQGRVLVGDEKGLSWLDPASGTRAPAGPGFKNLMDLEVGPDGTLYAMAEWKVHVIRDGKEVAGESSKSAPGEKPQLIDGAWYAHGWHSTIKRYDLAFAPAPGVVLGGNSGSFIGHVAESPDIINGRGLARLESGEWAVSCLQGGMCLLGWDGVRRQFDVLRRIGALPAVNALTLDGQGRISVGIGFWRWDDLPDTPLREGQGVSGGSLCQPAPLGGGRFVAVGQQWGTPRLWAGQADGWRSTDLPKEGSPVPPDTVGVAAVPEKDGFLLVSLTRAGKGQGFVLVRDGGLCRSLGSVTLQTEEPRPKVWTSLAVDPERRLLAAADGAVLVFERGGDGWKETRRWHSWGDGDSEHFGKELWIQAEGDRLWVSDTERHRVIRFDLTSGRPTVSFGEADKAGNDLGHLDSPRMIAPAGDRCVVHDAGNQRLLKLKAN